MSTLFIGMTKLHYVKIYFFAIILLSASFIGCLPRLWYYDTVSEGYKRLNTAKKLFSKELEKLEIRVQAHTRFENDLRIYIEIHNKTDQFLSYIPGRITLRCDDVIYRPKRIVVDSQELDSLSSIIIGKDKSVAVNLIISDTVGNCSDSLVVDYNFVDSEGERERISIGEVLFVMKEKR